MIHNSLRSRTARQNAMLTFRGNSAAIVQRRLAAGVFVDRHARARAQRRFSPARRASDGADVCRIPSLARRACTDRYSSLTLRVSIGSLHFFSSQDRLRALPELRGQAGVSTGNHWCNTISFGPLGGWPISRGTTGRATCMTTHWRFFRGPTGRAFSAGPWPIRPIAKTWSSSAGRRRW